ncbi:hypothetical protein QTP88_006617 [Uroleucon formosanum]
MKCSNMNAESLDFMKSKGMTFNFEDCTKKLKQDREKSIPIKSITQTKGDSNIYMNSELDTRTITTRLDELIKNQMITNDTLLTLIEISNVKKEPNEEVETIVNDIAGIIDVDINLFDIENVYRKLSNLNLEAPQIVVEFFSKKKEKNSLRNGEKLNSKDQEYILMKA